MREKILIVEDDLELAEMLKLYFDGRGYQTVTAGFGEEGVAQALAFNPELVILDIFLPDIDGYEVCRRLRAQQRTSHIPILFLTGRRGREAKIAGLELGAVDYIVKPFDMPELAARIESILRRSSFRPLDHPVTHLPGEQLFMEHLATLRRQAGWRITRVEVENLEGIAEAYGFVVRDDILRAVALKLQDVVAEQAHTANFAAHPEQDVFYLIAAAGDGDRSAELGQRITQVIAPFYPHREIEKNAGGRVPSPLIRIYISSLAAQQAAHGTPDDWLALLTQGRRLAATLP